MPVCLARLASSFFFVLAALDVSYMGAISGVFSVHMVEPYSPTQGCSTQCVTRTSPRQYYTVPYTIRPLDLRCIYERGRKL